MVRLRRIIAFCCCSTVAVPDSYAYAQSLLTRATISILLLWHGFALIFRTLLSFCSALWAHGVVVVATSNRRPEELYEGGINRFLFLPFIELVRQRCECLDMTDALFQSTGSHAIQPPDYRLRYQDALACSYSAYGTDDKGVKEKQGGSQGSESNAIASQIRQQQEQRTVSQEKKLRRDHNYLFPLSNATREKFKLRVYDLAEEERQRDCWGGRFDEKQRVKTNAARDPSDGRSDSVMDCFAPEHIAISPGRRLLVPRSFGGIALFKFSELFGQNGQSIMKDYTKAVRAGSSISSSSRLEKAGVDSAMTNSSRSPSSPCGAADFIALSQRYHTIMLEDMPKLSSNKHNEARRFITFVDIICKLPCF